MRRRFQLTLRSLLGLALTVSFLLGGRHLLETYGSRLDVESAKIGAPIRVKARYFCLFGPTECELEVGYETADGSQLSADGTTGMSWGYRVKGSWLCLYRLESEFEPIDSPCQIIVGFKRYERPVDQRGGRVWTLREKIMDVK